MQINKFVKKRNGMYKIVFNNSELEIHEDLILKYDLLIKKELTEDLISKLETENLKYKAYDVALKELKKRLRSKKELKDILTKKGYDSSLSDEVINLLTDQGYLNDSTYIESYIHDQILFSSSGPLKIKQDLIIKRISPNQIEDRLEVFTEDLERERIEKIINKNLKSNKKSISSFKIHMRQSLNRLGYHLELVDNILSKISFDEENFQKKEYDKLYRKLSKKYSGQELEYKIKQRLYQKGFHNNID